MITAQLRAVATDLKINAVKTGMLGDRATVEVVTAGLREFRLAPLVVDPVMVATSGDVLLAPDAVSAVRRELIPLADLITPNLHEAAHLLDRPAASFDYGHGRSGSPPAGSRRQSRAGQRADTLKEARPSTCSPTPTALSISRRRASPRATRTAPAARCLRPSLQASRAAGSAPRRVRRERVCLARHR